MNSRIRLVITAIALCHLLLMVPVVTCQLPSTNSAPQSAELPGWGQVIPAEEVTIRTSERQEKQGDIYKLKGDVEITFRNYTLRADEVTYNAGTGEINATGGVVFEGGPHDAHVEASHGTYNIQTESGNFYDVVGSIGTRFRGKNVIITSNSPFMFTGREVIKSGRSRFIVLHGTVTSCQLPNPKWTFNTEKADVIAGEDAKIYHSTFRIKGVPLFYFPYATHPVDSFGRRSGFLLPSIGQSSRKGFILGESVYWAINRSMDAAVGAEYWSQRGWAEHAEYRARPSQKSYVNFRYYGVQDRGDPVTGEDQGGEEASMRSELELPLGFRGVANLNYLSSFVFRVAFSESYAQAVNSEVKSVAFASKNANGYSFDVMASRYQNFQSTQNGDYILLVHAPNFEGSSVERRIFDSRLVWSFDANGEGVSRREPDFVTSNLVGRFDVEPRLALPLVFSGWSLRPEIGLSETYYTESQIPTPIGAGIPVSNSLNRRALLSSVEIRPPAMARVFDKELLGRKIKHVIEPRITYRYTTGIDRFRNVIRFDERDILSDTSEVEAGIIQRWYGKRTKPVRQTACVEPTAEDPMAPTISMTTTPQRQDKLPGTSVEVPKCEEETPAARELVSWEVKQKYFFNEDFGNAIIFGRRNVLTSTADFAGIAFLTDPRRWSPVVSRLKVHTSPNTDVDWELDYDFVKGRINSSTAMLEHRFKEYFVGGSQAFLHVPGEIVTTTSSLTGQVVNAPDVFNQFRVLAGYGRPGKPGLSAAASVGYDYFQKFIQYGTVQTSYNWDCCGVSVEYRRFALGSVRNENQFRFAFTLANVGTFGNLRRQERLF